MQPPPGGCQRQPHRRPAAYHPNRRWLTHPRTGSEHGAVTKNPHPTSVQRGRAVSLRQPWPGVAALSLGVTVAEDDAPRPSARFLAADLLLGFRGGGRGRLLLRRRT